MEIIKDINKLRIKSEPVQKEDSWMYLAEQMFNVMLENKGVGLAAIQVGIPERLFVMKDQKHGDLLAIVNPKIDDIYDPFIYPDERCLSFPGVSLSTNRFKYVRMTYWCYNKQLEEFVQRTSTFDGNESVVVQHEYDHLEGIVMSDKEYKSKEVGRNDPCPCGSGKKFKKCCDK